MIGVAAKSHPQEDVRVEGWWYEHAPNPSGSAFSLTDIRSPLPSPPRCLMTKNEKTQASSINDAACRKFKTTTGEFSTSSDNKILIQNPDPNLGIPLDPKIPPDFYRKKQSKSACRAAAYASVLYGWNISPSAFGTYEKHPVLSWLPFSTPSKN